MDAVYEFIEAFRDPLEAAGMECWFRVTDREVVIRHSKGDLYGTLHISRLEAEQAISAASAGSVMAERVFRGYQKKGGN